MSLLQLEFYKLFKRWQSSITLFLVCTIIIIYNALRLRKYFYPAYIDWAKLSGDPNPYNFYINKKAFFLSYPTVIFLLMVGIMLTGLEYKNDTIQRIKYNPTGFNKTFFVKVTAMLLLGIFFYCTSTIIFNLIASSVYSKHHLLFSKYSDQPIGKQLIFYSLMFACIVKICFFHHFMMSIAKKQIFIPLIIGLLSVFLIIFNILPYGFFYTTFSREPYINYKVLDGIKGLAISLSLYTLFLNNKVQYFINKFISL